MSQPDETQGARYDPPPGLVALGTHVTVELIDRDGNAEEMEFDLAPEAGADLESGFLGANTPLARAIMGRPAGASVPYRMGDLEEVRIVAVERSRRTADPSAAAAREAAAKEAADRAALEETIQLALTFSSKWGDYDPAALEREEDEDDE